MEISVRFVQAPAFTDSPLGKPAAAAANHDPAYSMYRQYAEDLVRNEMKMWARIVFHKTPATAKLLHDVSIRWPLLDDKARRFGEQQLRQAQLDFLYRYPNLVDTDDFEVVEKVEGGEK
ncbi:hypothetical protein AURDEDRAFT_131579 [Auricularia subglabra TFB-10046 SS5]|uniref:Uncharacterized protein n=1 Tax=Auricularia subglabra (strain TFB-10046 / SS5) TaxID=717982 RepID=J0WMQ0_AURST|nr:hypothetical protein AURDEDRAFT_131579 [Auricularia subglabra TFB-10046 SS5]